VKSIVFDTNITISALFWKGCPRQIYDLVKAKEIKLLYSIDIEKELIRVLAYPKFGLLPAEILPIVNNLRKYTHFIETKSKIDVVIEDPTDNIFLECALDGNADYIISGDKHLLNVISYENIKIVKAKDFLTIEKII